MAIKYIFSINPGRCGSDYLTEIFCNARGTASYHEAFPILNGPPMQAFNDGNQAPLNDLLPLKIKEITRQRRKGRKVYCETNHCFIEGWGYLIPDNFIPQEEMGVVILKREPEKVIQSLLRCHEVPGSNYWCDTWYLSPSNKNNLVEPQKALTREDLCEWYLKEIECRSEQYQKQFPRISYFSCDLEQLNSLDFVLEMFSFFGLSSQPSLEAVVGKKLNQRDEWPLVPVAELTNPAPFPSADALPAAERDALLLNSIGWIQKNREADIRRIKPDLAMGGSIGVEVNRIVAHSLSELEKEFRHQISFTNMESDLVYELLFTLAPYDAGFVVLERETEPYIHFHLNFNQTLDLWTVAKRLGWRGIASSIGLFLKGRWGADPTHRNDNSKNAG